MQSVYAWNGIGHELIAEIALLQLSSSETARLQGLNQACLVGPQVNSLAKAAAWLDWVRHDPQLLMTQPYHYIDLPFSPDGTKTKPPLKDNAVTAILHASTVLTDKKSNDAEKCLQLRILMHVVGDIHQPLHAINRYSQAFPVGDRGGNDFILGKNRVAGNLHAYWDRGGGSLTKRERRSSNLKNRAKAILKQYPCTLSSMPINPTDWAEGSYTLAQKIAYQVSENEAPTIAYQKQVKAITTSRLALAGCRLAVMLKQVQ